MRVQPVCRVLGVERTATRDRRQQQEKPDTRQSTKGSFEDTLKGEVDEQAQRQDRGW